MTELSDYCQRCGEPREGVGEGIDALCWPPGKDDYRKTHLFSLAGRDRARKKDQEKLEAWTKAATSC